MAPSKNQCLVSSKSFFGKQKRLQCTGKCAKIFCTDCIEVNDDDYDKHMSEGRFTYEYGQS